MKVPFRTLVNPLILNDTHYIGFQGNSEYIDEDENLQMGYWSFLGASVTSEDELTLDDTVDDSILNDHTFLVKNDNGLLCFIRFNY